MYLEDDFKQPKGDCVLRALRQEYVDDPGNSSCIFAEAVGETSESRHDNRVVSIFGVVGSLYLSHAVYNYSKTFGRCESFPLRGAELKLLQAAFGGFERRVGGCIEAMV